MTAGNKLIPVFASDFDDFDSVQPAKESTGPDATCVFFGAERLARVRDAARANKQTVSAYVQFAVDAGMTIAGERLERLEALAKLRGVSPMALLAGLVDRATSSV